MNNKVFIYLVIGIFIVIGVSLVLLIRANAVTPSPGNGLLECNTLKYSGEDAIDLMFFASESETRDYSEFLEEVVPFEVMALPVKLFNGLETNKIPTFKPVPYVVRVLLTKILFVELSTIFSPWLERVPLVVILLFSDTLLFVWLKFIPNPPDPDSFISWITQFCTVTFFLPAIFTP